MELSHDLMEYQNSFRKIRKMLHFYRMKYLFFISFLSVYLMTYSCSKEKSRVVRTGFYHWRTEFALTDFEKSTLKETQTEKIYVKFFDVDWNGKEAIPQAILQTKDAIEIKSEIVPTIFITNRTFQNLDAAGIDDLIDKISQKVENLFSAFPSSKLQEIQFDCDWSESTRVAYFSFLNKLKTKYSEQKIQLSATIRLHQIKFFERTGVPPVKRGMLMFYNTGELRDWATKNSILDLTTAEKYLVNFKEYPLDLDLALPLFRWGVLFRENKMVRLLNNLTEEDLRDTSFFQKTASQRYFVKKNNYLAGHYIYQGDKIRLEKISQEKLASTIQILKSIWPTDDFYLTFYHIDSVFVQHYESENLLLLKNELERE